jgi:hypothetical protein
VIAVTSTYSRSLGLPLLAATWLLTANVCAQAQTNITMHYKEVHYEVANGVMGVGQPADARVVGVWSRRGVTMFDSGELAAYSALGDYDITKGSGTISGYDTTYFPDGSTWSTKFKGQFSVGPNGLWVIPHEGVFVKGTGRFEGISGTLVYTSKQVDKRPDFNTLAETEGTATFTLPPKH